jgi:tetratricopeptide (TPR) repeat protein
MPGTLFPRLQPARYRAIAALLLATTAHAADWLTLRGAGVELFSDAPEKTARQALQRLAEIQSILPTQSQPDAAPLRVFLFSKQSEYRAYAPQPASSGYYASGFERDYVAMYADAGIPRVVAHEYVHYAAHQRNVSRPAWLEEGLAEFYSNFDGRQLGAPIAEHLKLLEKSWLTAEQMNQPRALDTRFYAQSWALVHMLRREPQFPERVTDQMLVQLRPYLKTMRATALKSGPPSAPLSLEPVSALNALLLRADLALHSQKPALARTLYTQAAAAFPNSSAVETGLGTLAYAAGDNAGARARLKRALELNDGDALAWFELALMENDPAALERAAQLNPNLAEAHVLLGVRATDDGNLGAALEHLEQATRLLPRKSYAWYSLGYAHSKRGDINRARQALEQALQTATTPEQRAMAATLLDSLSRK